MDIFLALKDGLKSQPELVTLVVAELFFIVAKSQDIKVIIKRKIQRTHNEQLMIMRGLRRDVFLDLLLFVPFSAILLLLITPLFIGNILANIKLSQYWYAFYSLLGLICYGFPFSAVVKLVRQIAIRNFNKYPNISIPPNMQ